MRIIPSLQLLNGSLVKTRQYKNHVYIGDPVNTCRIFNELEIDELSIIDIRATIEGYSISWDILKDISSECFIPLSYGGGLNSLSAVENILALGYEKVILNTALFEDPCFVKEAVERFGSQSIIGAIDVRKKRSQYIPYIRSGTYKIPTTLSKYIYEIEHLGVGEILLTDITNEGTWNGIDISLIKSVENLVTVPIIIRGGFNSIEDINRAFKHNIDAIALGNMVVFQKKDCGVLINFPKKENISRNEI